MYARTSSLLDVPLVALLLVAPAATRVAASDADFPVFESAHVRPLALSPERRHLFAVNTPDNRLEVFRLEHGTLLRRGETVVGLEPVAVAARSEDEVWVVNHLSDSVSVVDVSDPGRPFVKATLETGDEPRDIVIAGPGRDRIFVTAARRGQSRPGAAELTTPGVGRADVWVFEASDLSAEPQLVTLFCDTPRALAASADGRTVYAAAFHSGNRTTVLHDQAVSPLFTPLIDDGFVAPGMLPPLETDDGVPAPGTGLIVRFDGERWVDAGGRDWTPRVRFDLPDLDVFAIDATADPPRQTETIAGVGTVLFDVAVHPLDGRLYVANIESRNHVRFEPELRGRLADNRITIVDGGAPRAVTLNPHIDLSSPFGSPEEVAASLAMPLDMAFSDDGATLYVAAFGSGEVAVLDDEAQRVGRVPVGAGPSGLALDDRGRRLYVMNRIDQSISVVDLERGEEIDIVPLAFDPEPEAVRAGRRVFYDARLSSGHGDASCATCHVFGDLDGLAWDLGDPGGALVDATIDAVDIPFNDLLDSFHPMKGPLVTQSLRGLDGAGPMHWRGDRNGGPDDPADERASFLTFQPAFESLMGRPEPLPDDAMERLADFALSLRYPPNPVAPLDGGLTPLQAAGQEIFESDGRELGGDGQPCTLCHAGRTGTSGLGVRLVSQNFEVAQLRNLYQKVGMYGYAVPGVHRVVPRELDPTPTPHVGPQVRGFGFGHDGSVPTLFDFFRRPRDFFAFFDEPGRDGLQKVRELEAFLLAFPTGLAPIVGQQVTLDAASDAAALDRFALFVARATAGDGDLVLHGLLDERPRGFVLDAASTPARFESDRREDGPSLEALREAIASGRAVLTATVVPPGSGARVGIDRDGDGARDGDELDAGFDPADPDSRPAPLVLRGDCNADLAVDIADARFALNALFLGGVPPDCADACDANADLAMNIADAVFVLNFLFLGGPAPGSYPECEAVGPECGDRCEK